MVRNPGSKTGHLAAVPGRESSIRSDNGHLPMPGRSYPDQWQVGSWRSKNSADSKRGVFQHSLPGVRGDMDWAPGEKRGCQGVNSENNRTHWRYELGIFPRVLPHHQRNDEGQAGWTTLSQVHLVLGGFCRNRSLAASGSLERSSPVNDRSWTKL